MNFLSSIKNTSKPTVKKENPSIHRIPLPRAIIAISGGLFVLFILLVLVAMTLSMQQTMQHATHQEALAHIKIHNLKLVKASQQTLAGNEIAFTQLENSRDLINDNIALLSLSNFHNYLPASSVNDEIEILLDVFHSNLNTELKKVNLILRNKETLMSLGQVVNEINIVSAQLLKLIDQLIHRMEETGSSPRDLAAIDVMKMRVQMVTTNINLILSANFTMVDIASQLATDKKRLSVITTAPGKGNKALEIQEQIPPLVKTIEAQINTFQQKTPEIITTKYAVQELVKNSEKSLNEIDALGHAFKQSNVISLLHFRLTIYAAGILSVLALFVLIKTLISGIREQRLVKEKETQSTQKAILQLLDDMNKVAEGDLTIRTQVTKDITGTIADSFNITVEELQRLIKKINWASTQVTSASDQARSVSLNLQTATQQQAIEIEQTTLALLDIAESISTVSESATKSSQVAKQSLAVMKKGSSAALDSITGMNEIRFSIQETSKRIKRLGESSQEIGEIIALLSDITEQTNVLALNTAIQSTSAGETGRGFSVITQEVKRLAAQSAEATQQISTLANTIQRDTQDAIAAMEKSTTRVAEGTVHANAAAQALEEIEQVLSHFVQLATDIFDNTHIQTQTTNKVVRNMEAILAVTHQTTDDAKQTATSVKEMTDLTATLKASAASFKV